MHYGYIWHIWSIPVNTIVLFFLQYRVNIHTILDLFCEESHIWVRNPNHVWLWLHPRRHNSLLTPTVIPANSTEYMRHKFMYKYWQWPCVNKDWVQHAATVSRSRARPHVGDKSAQSLWQLASTLPLSLVELYLICAFGEGGFGAAQAPGQGKGVGSVLHPLRSCSSSCRPHWRAADQLESSSLNTKPDLGKLPGAHYKQGFQFNASVFRMFRYLLGRKVKNVRASFNHRTADIIWISPWYVCHQTARPK